MIAAMDERVNGNQVEESPHDRLLRRATYASVATACGLIAIKGGAWLFTGSVSLLSTLIESLMDVFASLVNLFAVRHALQPADRWHRFGYGKAEPLAGLAQAAFIAGSAVFLLFAAVDRLVTPEPIKNEVVGIVVMVMSIIITAVLIRFQTYVVRETKSLAISADSLHYKSDFLIHGSVIISLTLSMTLGWTIADPLLGIVIAVYILITAKKISERALDVLMDREFEDKDRARIREIALAHDEVVNMHDLRTRSSGPRSFIQLHLDLARDTSLWHSHEISDQVEAKIRAAFPDADVIIHQDPEGVDEERAAFAGEEEEDAAAGASDKTGEAAS